MCKVAANVQQLMRGQDKASGGWWRYTRRVQIYLLEMDGRSCMFTGMRMRRMTYGMRMHWCRCKTVGYKIQRPPAWVRAGLCASATAQHGINRRASLTGALATRVYCKSKMYKGIAIEGKLATQERRRRDIATGGTLGAQYWRYAMSETVWPTDCTGMVSSCGTLLASCIYASYNCVACTLAARVSDAAVENVRG